MAGSSISPSSAALVARSKDSWSYSYTSAKGTKVSHRWVIDNFPLLCRGPSKNKLKSNRFPDGGGSKWHLELDTDYQYYYEDRDYIDGDFVRLSLYLDKPAITSTAGRKVSSITAECKVSILNSKGKRCQEKAGFIESIQSKGCYWVDNLIGRDDLLITRAKELLVGDRLTILCKLHILFSSSDTFTVMSLPIAPPSNNLIADLGSLLEGGQHSDVTLVAGGKEYQAHKCILSARSPVFKAMFQHDMREREEKKVDISDLSADTVQEMLQHIYTGEVSTLEQSAESLLEAADKYDLPSLKSACEGTLRSKLEVKNAARLLMLADKHHAEQLRADCMGVIVANPMEVKESEGWSDVSERLDLLAEAGQLLFS